MLNVNKVKLLSERISGVTPVIFSGVRPTEQGTRSPIELFWTAKNHGSSILLLLTYLCIAVQ